MIRPGSLPGVMFGGAADGDPRRDATARRRMAAAAGIGVDWAWMRQVHGATVVRATGPGVLGEADAVFTTVPGLPLAVGIADCYPVVLVAEEGVGIAHAGWRGVLAGVVAELRAAMTAAGTGPTRAAIGPGIGPCCFEVGSEVAERFPGFASTTSRGTPGVDLPAALRAQLVGLTVWESGVCTMSDAGYHSFRRDGTAHRQAGVAWLIP
ncbi:MAG: polyphenol oxidase family protein [Acidimicrobiia bacterium]|nr:polyphenol oxidase family protein [Acidimicrobiia bacterium]